LIDFYAINPTSRMLRWTCCQYFYPHTINTSEQHGFHGLADEVRHYGNLGARPDDDQLENANSESAEQVLEFAQLLIHEFYEVPAAATRLRQNRQDRKNVSPNNRIKGVRFAHSTAQ